MASPFELVCKTLRFSRVRMAFSALFMFALSSSGTLLFAAASPLGRLLVITFLPAVSFISFGLLTVDWLRSREESVRLLRSVRAEKGRVALYLLKWAAVPFSIGGIFGAIVGLFLYSSKVLFVEGVNADPFFLTVFGFAAGLAGSTLGLVAGVVAEWRG